MKEKAIKVLIWVLCFLIGITLNVLIGVITGVMFGGLVVLLVVIFTAKKICDIREDRMMAKEISNSKKEKQ